MKNTQDAYRDEMGKLFSKHYDLHMIGSMLNIPDIKIQRDLMLLSEMSDIQLQELTLRWNIEYEQSYLNSLLDGIVTSFDVEQEIADAERRVLEAEVEHYEFVQKHAEHFI